MAQVGDAVEEEEEDEDNTIPPMSVEKKVGRKKFFLEKSI